MSLIKFTRKSLNLKTLVAFYSTEKNFTFDPNKKVEDKKDNKTPPLKRNKKINSFTGEINGPKGPEPTRYGDWQHKGRVTDF